MRCSREMVTMQTLKNKQCWKCINRPTLFWQQSHRRMILLHSWYQPCFVKSVPQLDCKFILHHHTVVSAAANPHNSKSEHCISKTDLNLCCNSSKVWQFSAPPITCHDVSNFAGDLINKRSKVGAVDLGRIAEVFVFFIEFQQPGLGSRYYISKYGTYL